MSDFEEVPGLTVEQERALDAHGGIVQGESFVLMRTDFVLRLFGYESSVELRRELQPAFEQADRGELEEWNVDDFLARMRRPNESQTE